MKTCTKCGELKALDAFHQQKGRGDGVRSVCKICRLSAMRSGAERSASEVRQQWVAANRGHIREQAQKRRESYLSADSTYRQREAAAYYAKHRDKILQQAAAPTQAQRAKRQARGRANYAANKAAYKARAKLRKALLIQRVPPWADLDAIAAVYVKAAEIAELTGEPVHVDHDIPLCGKLVSGLHVHTNLVIRHATENLRKSNRFEVA